MTGTMKHLIAHPGVSSTTGPIGRPPRTSLRNKHPDKKGKVDSAWQHDK